MKPSKNVSDPYTTVQDPNKVPGWPPAAEPASPQTPSMYPNAIPPEPTASPAYAPTTPPAYAPSAPPYEPTAPPPPPPPPASAPAPAPAPAPAGGSAPSLVPLNAPAVGAFKDRSHDLKDVPAATLTGGQPTADRLAMLKTRVNELQKIREGYWRKQGLAMAAGGATALVSLGVGLAAGAAAGVHQRNKLEQVKKAIRAILAQINLVRFQFGTDPAVHRADASVKITEAVFKRDIHRDELSGDL